MLETNRGCLRHLVHSGPVRVGWGGDSGLSMARLYSRRRSSANEITLLPTRYADAMNRHDPIPGDDPNEAYEIIPNLPKQYGPPAGWWRVTCNGIPIRLCSPAARAFAERYISDPDYRQSLVRQKIYDVGGPAAQGTNREEPP